MDYGDFYAVAPLKFRIDLRACGKSLRELAKLCGTGKSMMVRVLKGLPVVRARLDDAMATFYGTQEDSVLRMQMRGIMGCTNYKRGTVMRLLRIAMKLAEQYGDEVSICEQTRNMYVFPPRDTLLSMIKAVEACSKLARDLHAECPEYDYLVFKETPDLLKRLQEEDKAGERG